LKAYLDQNIYAFSGAKSITVLKEYNRLLQGDDGAPVSLAEFKKRVLSIDTLYNKTYLDAEYTNAVGSAQMAEKWQTLKGFKMLEYRTVGDDRVRPAHAALDKLILKSTDPLWNKIYPPNGWHCRCTVIPAADSDTLTEREHAKDLAKSADVQPYFKNNVGKTKIIYRDDHPYFKNVKDSVKELDAEINYGLPGVEAIYRKGDFPAIAYLPDKTTALQWWAEQAGGVRKSFDVKAADGLTVTFDNAFRNHVLEQNGDSRFKFINRAPEVLQKPDEIWSRLVNGKPSLTYIKYYEKYPIVVQVDAGESVRGSSIYEMQHFGKLNVAEVIKIRKGQLKFKQ
jgi:SPP1 gp7 family putative phage head morphogenesis protein